MSKDESFCSDVEAFKNLLRVDTNIKIKGEEIIYKGVKFRYQMMANDIADKKERFFDLKFSCEDESSIDNFNLLLRDIRVVCSKIKGTLNLLWDDTSLYYTKNAYPMVYRAENLLRKLITKFMLTTIGSEWAKNLVPDEVKLAAGKQAKKRGENNPLFEVDFITLSEFLFKPYHTSPVENLLDEIKTSTVIEDLSLDKLKSYLPKSNWEKYFSKIVACEDEYLRKRWSRLYELRCQIAHNASLSHSDFKDVERISTELETIFSKAIDSLDELKVSTEEKIEIAEALAQSSDEQKGILQHNWMQNVIAIRTLYEHYHPDETGKQESVFLVHKLHAEGLLSEDFKKGYSHISKMRSRALTEKEISSQEIEAANEEVKMFGLRSIFLEEPFASLGIDVHFKK